MLRVLYGVSYLPESRNQNLRFFMLLLRRFTEFQAKRGSAEFLPRERTIFDDDEKAEKALGSSACHRTPLVCCTHMSVACNSMGSQTIGQLLQMTNDRRRFRIETTTKPSKSQHRHLLLLKMLWPFHGSLVPFLPHGARYHGEGFLAVLLLFCSCVLALAKPSLPLRQTRGLSSPFPGF